MADLVHSLNQFFLTSFSFEVFALILGVLQCANITTAANSLPYSCRQRASGLLRLMDLADHTNCTDWKIKVKVEKAAEVVNLQRDPLRVPFLLVSTWKKLIWQIILEHNLEEFVSNLWVAALESCLPYCWPSFHPWPLPLITLIFCCKTKTEKTGLT